PFGYEAVAAETRGVKVKKRLKIKQDEAEIVELIWDLAVAGGVIKPLGVRSIAKELNRRTLTTRSGRPWTSTEVHRMLHSTTYIGQHVFNVRDSRTRKAKPRDKWIVVSVPRIIEK